MRSSRQTPPSRPRNPTPATFLKFSSVPLVSVFRKVQVYNILNRRNTLDVAFGAAVLLLVVWQLFVPPVLSVANDHDFEKILGSLCLGPAPTSETPYFDYTVLPYTYDTDSCIDWPMRTTNHAAFRVGLWLDHVI